MNLAVGGAAGASEIEAADLGVLVADPVLTLGSHNDLDGACTVLDDPVPGGTRASLGHDDLLCVMVVLLFV
jgi:hypothetical protein